jgi:cell division septation protein DedD
MAIHTAGRAMLWGTICVALAACDGENPFAALTTAPDPAGASTEEQPASDGEAVEAEAPDVFGVTDTGLWDGRPSLGGVWVAYPEVSDPERVVIRNEANGSYVIGALFRRERDNPGPRFQISSDAAEALNVLAGQPTELEVVALRKVVREPAARQSEEAATAAAAPPQEAAPVGVDPAAIAAAAIAQSEGREINFDPALPAPPTAPAPAPIATQTLDQVAPAVSALEKPFIQIGIFNDQANARRTADQMAQAGLAVETLAQESQGKSFFRVIVGPAPTIEARAQALSTVKSLGFTDAYFVTN